MIGSALISLLLPHLRSVSTSISSLALKKSVNLSPGLCANSIHSYAAVGVFISWIMIGLLVTILVPLGRKSLPTMLSSTLLFPED